MWMSTRSDWRRWRFRFRRRVVCGAEDGNRIWDWWVPVLHPFLAWRLDITPISEQLRMNSTETLVISYQIICCQNPDDKNLNEFSGRIRSYRFIRRICESYELLQYFACLTTKLNICYCCEKYTESFSWNQKPDTALYQSRGRVHSTHVLCSGGCGFKCRLANNPHWFWRWCITLRVSELLGFRTFHRPAF
jgi:hypothetical protein